MTRAGKAQEKTHGISSSRTEQHRLGGRNLISRNALSTHFPCHERLVCPEIRAIPHSFARERRGLSFEDTCDPVCAPDLADGIERTCIMWVDRRLCLQACAVVRINLYIYIDISSTTGGGCVMHLRIRMCSTGPETTPLARPARAPADTS